MSFGGKKISLKDQIITFATITNKTFGDAAFATDAAASSGLALVYATSDSKVATVYRDVITIRGAGTVTITASQPGNSKYNAAPSVSQTFTVNKADQVITFAALSNKTLGDSAFAAGASSSSGSLISYTSGNAAVATVYRDIITIRGPGSTLITAKQAGNSNYNPAPDVVQTLVVNKKGQVINFPVIADKTWGDSAFAAAASATSGGLITYTTSDAKIASIYRGVITLRGCGMVTITASQTGTAAYDTAAPVSQTFTVNKATQAITFPPLPDTHIDDPSFVAGSFSSAPLGLTYVSSDRSVAYIYRDTVRIIGVGTATITAKQAGNAFYLPAADVTRTITILPSSGPRSKRSGNWNDTTTWNCNCIPQAGSNIEIRSPHKVIVDSAANAADVIIDNGSTLMFNTGKNLNITGNFNNLGTFEPGEGSVTFNGSSLQTITGAGVTSFYDIVLNNAQGAAIGNSTILNSITATAGTFNAGVNTVTLKSDAAKTAFIGVTGATGGYAGNHWIIQRYISARNANWGDLGSPVQNSTIGDWDQELYMSGVGGNDGNACCPIYYSVYRYNEPTAGYVAITSTSTALTPTKGFEVFLGSSTTTLNATTLDTRGTPNFGDKVVPVIRTAGGPDPGWNLISNPFAAPIAWDALIKSNLDATYYIFDNVTGTYAAYGAGTTIPSTQGFYVHSSAGSPALTIPEAAKATSTSSVFYRQSVDPAFTLKLSNDKNPFSQIIRMELNATATGAFDGSYDARFLKSPEKKAPVMYMLTSDKVKVIGNTFAAANAANEVALVVGAGVSGVYTLSTAGIENISKSYKCVYLEDVEAKKLVNLKETSAYSFILQEGLYASRFILHLSNAVNTCEAIVAAGKTENNREENKVKEEIILNKTSVTPNPVKETFTLKIPSARAGMSAIIITDAAGAVIMNLSKRLSIGENQIQVNASAWQRGQYFVKTSIGGKAVTSRLIKL